MTFGDGELGLVNVYVFQIKLIQELIAGEYLLPYTAVSLSIFCFMYQ